MRQPAARFDGDVGEAQPFRHQPQLLRQCPRGAIGLGVILAMGRGNAQDAGLAVGLEVDAARRPIAESRLTQPDLLEDCLAFIEDSLPLLEFGWLVLSTIGPARG